tara:strand:- start:1851 stop:3317 length:1467 start_codon:yes stop_codon:yes gene_type:complete
MKPEYKFSLLGLMTPFVSIAIFVSAPALTNAQNIPELLSIDPRKMEFEPVKFTPPKPERLILENGMIVYLLPDHELPLISINVMVKTGAIYEPADKVGLAGMTGSIMRTGGSGNRTGDEIDEAIEFISANINVHVGSDSGSASLDVLKKDLNFALGIFVDMLRTPQFEQGKLDLAKKRALENIRRQNDRPSGIASREFYKVLYGHHHPYGRISTAKGISSITRDDLKTFHQTYFHPNSMMLGVTGDFEREEMISTLRNVFGDWPKSDVTFPSVPPVNPNIKGSVNHVEKDVTQTHLRIGHLSIRQNHQDYFALAILDDILGAGGFSSRLFQDVRTRQGIAYSVGSTLRAGNFDLGSLLLYAQTKSETTHQAITSMMAHLKRMSEEQVTPEELNRAKDAFLNSFVFSFSNAGAIVSRLMSLEYYELPSDFLERYRDNVVKLTADDLLTAAKTHYHPDNLTIMTVGKAQAFKKALSTFGPVQIIPLTEEE